MKKKLTNFVLNIIHKIESFHRRTKEGGFFIRYTRLRKFKKRSKSIIILSQILAVWYVLIITGTYLTSYTGAYFNDVEVLKYTLHAANWEVEEEVTNDEWDNSSLDFDHSKAWSESCSVFTTITNAGDRANTISTWMYYLYKVDNGELSSEPVAKGKVPIIESKAEGLITANVKEDGYYKFVVRRPLGHPAKNNPDENGYTYIKSDNVIEVKNCADDEEVITDPPIDNEDSTEPPNQEGPDDTAETEDPNEGDNEPEPELEPLGEVTSITSKSANKGNSGKFIISWKNPESPSFDHVVIYSNDTKVETVKGVQQVELQGDKDGKIFTIKTVDKSGNESIGITLVITKDSVILQ